MRVDKEIFEDKTVKLTRIVFYNVKKVQRIRLCFCNTKVHVDPYK